MTFAEQFARSRGKSIEVDGRLVHAIYRQEARAGLRLRLRWIRSIEGPAQGVSVSIEGGTLRIAGSKSKDVVLWADTAPAENLLVCESRGAREISLWNCWRDDRGVTQAWVGNSGMIIEELQPGVFRFRCNSRPEVTFSDLEFELGFEEPSRDGSSRP